MLLHLTTLGNHDVLYGLPFWICKRSRVLNFGNNVHAFDDIAKDDVLAIQVGCSMLCGDDEELAAVRLWMVNQALVKL